MITHGYADFLIQNIIITTQDANDIKPIYELSLFGVMLCLVMIRYNNMDGLNGGLYHEYSFEKYYDMIALNYKDKLPLIFRKWNQLNLCSDSDIRVSEPRKYYHSKSFKPLNKTPRKGLSLLVEQDKEKPLIKEWLCKWRDDLTRLQSEVLDNIKAIV